MQQRLRRRRRLGLTRPGLGCGSASWMIARRRRRRAPPKKVRKKSAAWLSCVDQLLSKCCGVQLERYQVLPQAWDSSDPHGWPYLALTPDQGPDGVSAIYYAQYGQSLNVEVFYDLSHGVWRDQEQAVRDVSLEAFTHLMVIAYNLCHSPWGSEARFCALRESTAEYLDSDLHRCPLFRCDLVFRRLVGP